MQLCYSRLKNSAEIHWPRDSQLELRRTADLIWPNCLRVSTSLNQLLFMFAMILFVSMWRYPLHLWWTRIRKITPVRMTTPPMTDLKNKVITWLAVWDWPRTYQIHRRTFAPYAFGDWLSEDLLSRLIIIMFHIFKNSTNDQGHKLSKDWRCSRPLFSFSLTLLQTFIQVLKKGTFWQVDIKFW